MDQKSMHIFVKQQIRQHTSFGGARNDNVIQWLQDTEAIFDRVQLQPMNKYIVVQQYLVGTADKWFRYNNVNIPDWSSFKIAITQAFQPASNRTLSVVEQRSISVKNANPSSISSKTTPNSFSTFQDNSSAVTDLSGSISNKLSPPSSEIEKSSTLERIINDGQQLTIVVLPEPSSLHQFVNEIEDSTVVNISNNSSSILTSTQLTCSSTVAIDNPTTCEAELQELPNDQVNSYSSNYFHATLNELSSVTESGKANTRVNSENANVGTYVFRDVIYSMILGRYQIQKNAVNLSFSINRIYFRSCYICRMKMKTLRLSLVHYKSTILLIRDIYIYVKKKKKVLTLIFSSYTLSTVSSPIFFIYELVMRYFLTCWFINT
ncbi:unnamed protein product [Rotaria socialis]